MNTFRSQDRHYHACLFFYLNFCDKIVLLGLFIGSMVNWGNCKAVAFCRNIRSDVRSVFGLSRKKQDLLAMGVITVKQRRTRSRFTKVDHRNSRSSKVKPSIYGWWQWSKSCWIGRWSVVTRPILVRSQTIIWQGFTILQALMAWRSPLYPVWEPFAREAFQVDESEAKATFDLSLKFDQEEGEIALSNMPGDENAKQVFGSWWLTDVFTSTFAGDLQGVT